MNLLTDVHHRLIAFVAPGLGFINPIIVVADLYPKKISTFATLRTKIDTMREICPMDRVFLQQFDDLWAPFRVNFGNDIFESFIRLAYTDIETVPEPAVTA